MSNMSELMKNCPLGNENAACGLHSPETERTDMPVPAVEYCKECSQIVFQCADGHWNRAFARFCTQCGKELKKPATWEMASANPQRTATFSANSEDINFELNSGVVDTPQIGASENLPRMLVIDGLFVLPNPSQSRLEAYTIEDTKNGIQISQKWVIRFNVPLTYGSTPVYQGLHLYSVVSGGIQKTNVIDGKTELINNISGIDAAQIEPLPGCAPLKCDVDGKPTLIAGVKNGFLLFDFANGVGEYIQHSFFKEETEPMSPTLCGNYVVFTSLAEDILSINIGDNYCVPRLSSYEDLSFSAPITLGDLVYFEALSEKGSRLLVSYEPISDKLLNLGDFDSDKDLNKDLDRRHSLFIHPLLTDGERLFLADIPGETVHTYNIHRASFTKDELPTDGDRQLEFTPQRSVVVGEKIYSGRPAGLTILNLGHHFAVSYDALAMGRNDIPMVVAPPIWYGGNLFVLCKDRLVCREL